MRLAIPLSKKIQPQKGEVWIYYALNPGRYTCTHTILGSILSGVKNGAWVWWWPSWQKSSRGLWCVNHFFHFFFHSIHTGITLSFSLWPKLPALHKRDQFLYEDVLYVRHISISSFSQGKKSIYITALFLVFFFSRYIGAFFFPSLKWINHYSSIVAQMRRGW